MQRGRVAQDKVHCGKFARLDFRKFGAKDSLRGSTSERGASARQVEVGKSRKGSIVHRTPGFCILVVAGWLWLSPPAKGEFVPGRIYVTGIAGNCEFDPTVPLDSIFEFDPLTGSTRRFATVTHEQCGYMSGLAFSPDGARLRAAVYYRRSILEFDSAGVGTVVLDESDGFRGGPRGSNNVGFAANGDFFADYSGEILRFAGGNGPGQVIADAADGVTGSGPLAVTRDGDVFFAVTDVPNPTILHVDRFGNTTEFDTLQTPETLTSLALDGDENLYALLTDGLYRYDAGAPSSLRRLAPMNGAGPDASIAVSPANDAVYVCTNSVFRAVDPLTGHVTELGSFDSPDGYVLGSGIAVAIPEPAAFGLLLAGLAILARSRTV
jgi:hypothetical protein